MLTATSLISGAMQGVNMELGLAARAYHYILKLARHCGFGNVWGNSVHALGRSITIEIKVDDWLISNIQEIMLNQRSRVTLDTLLPREANTTLKYGVFDTDFDAFWADVERTALPAWRWGFRLALFSAIWIAPLLIQQLPPLSHHDRVTRERALAAMENSRIYILRQMLGLLKTIICFGYGADESVRGAIGYPHNSDDPHQQVPR